MGATGGGKSALIVRVVINEFMPDIDPTMDDSYRKMIKYHERPILLDIYDTQDEEEFD